MAQHRRSLFDFCRIAQGNFRIYLLQEGCASAWDTVEELSAEKSHEKAKNPTKDPLEQYCSDEPDADECRVHDV